MTINISKLFTASLISICLLGVLMSSITPTPLFAESQAQKTVLITGANRGIGLEFATQFSRQGYQVIGTARKPEKAKALKSLGARVEQLDVTDPNSIATLAATLKDVQIDVLINNAGVGGDTSATLETIDFDSLTQTFEINTFGPLRVTQALYKNMQKSDIKKIIQISSIMGSIENNRGGYYDYRASKAALNMLNKSLAAELSSAGYISVVLHPGWVKTDLGGANARLTPTESVTGMIKVIQGLDADDNARFYNYQGEELPW